MKSIGTTRRVTYYNGVGFTSATLLQFVKRHAAVLTEKDLEKLESLCVNKDVRIECGTVVERIA